VARPALAVAAVLAAAIVDGVAWWAVTATAVAACVRMLRLPGASVLVAAPVALVAPAAGALLTLRAVLGELVLLGVGHGETIVRRRRSGFERVVAARRRLLTAIDLPNSPYADARERLRSAAASSVVDQDELFERAVELLASAWAEARPLATADALAGLIRGGVFGRWEGLAGGVDFTGDLRRLVIMDGAGRVAVRLGFVVAAGVAAAVVVGPVEWWLADSGPATLVPPVAGAVAVATPAGRFERSIVGTVVMGIAVWVALGDDAAAVVAIGVACGIATHLTRDALERRSIAGPKADVWKLRLRTPRNLREQWSAADEAARDGRLSLAIEMLDEVTRLHAEARPALVAECHARIALWQLDAGRLGLAAERLDTMAAGVVASADGGAPSLSAAGEFAVGMLHTHLGDDELARDHLDTALRRAQSRSVLGRQIALALAETHARMGQASAALEVLEEHPPRRVGSSGVAALIDREVIVASALDSGDDRAAALARLEEMTQVSLSDSADLSSFPRGTAQVIASAEGRAFLLAGRLQLEDGRPQAAETLLTSALSRLSTDVDSHTRAIAQILRGRALANQGQSYQAAVTAISEGAQMLEQRRLQLRSSQRRTAMIVAGESVYEHALTALEMMDRTGTPDAGMVAAVLMESLRRSSISQMLRRGQGDWQARLPEEMSNQFADAFLPAPVRPADLQAVARRNGHVLAFHVAPGGGRAWWAWMSPEGVARIGKVGTRGVSDATHAIHRLRSGDGLTRAELYHPWEDSGSGWQQLADALLPPGLRDIVAAADEDAPVPILVVPDGYLAAVPWAALLVDGAPLVRRALIQIAPTYDLAGAAGQQGRVGDRPVVAHASAAAVDLLRDELTVQHARRRDEFVAALERRALGGAYIGSHGERTGLDQRVQFPDGEWLSAGDALAHPWPAWVVFAACVVGRIDPRAGGEPLGLPISCMLGGTNTVVAAVAKITGGRPDEPAPVTVRLFSQVGAALGDGHPPARTLREAQLRYLRSSRLPSVADGLGAVCISTRPLTT